MTMPNVIRKQYFNVSFNKRIAFHIYLLLTMLFLMSPIASQAGNKTHSGDELISLTAKEEPLADVLKKISMSTGYEIILDDNWRSYPVTVSLEEIPLNRGLKRILKDLNNAIVYVSSKKIEIIIYDKISHERESSASSNEKASNSPNRSYHPPAPGTRGSQVLEKEEAPPDDSAVSGEESETGISENDQRKKEKLEDFKTKTDERINKNLEDVSSEDRTDRNNQSESSSGEETESSQGPERSGNNE